MALSWKNITVARTDSGANVFGLARFLRDDDLICHDGPIERNDLTGESSVEHIINKIKKRHFQNYLALCPNHSAMYRHANGSKQIICDMVRDLEGNELEVILAQREMTIYLSKIHVLDIKAVLVAEANSPPEASDENAA